MNLFFNSAASDPASALARSQTNNQPALKPTFVLGDNPEINIYVTSGDGGFDPASGDASVTPSLGIGTPGAGPSGGTFWLGVSTATSGSLTTAKRYQIETYVAGDDFANLGAAENATGVVFTSSGTTPTDWTNGSALIEITTDVSYAASAATLEAALEATAAVVGVTVTKASAAPNFVVEWDSVGAVALLVGGPTSLTPASAVVTSELQAGSASAVERQIVRLTRQPYALQTVWSTIADGWSARLDCNTRGLLDFLEGEVSAGSTLELQLVDASQNVRTVGQVDCTIRNEAIDEASTIPTPFPSYLTATQVNQNFVQNRFQVTALDGGGTALDGIPTGTTALPTVPTDALVAIELGGDIFFYELVAGTDAESLPDVVRPDDYATTTNERVWLLRSVPSALPLHASTHEDGGTDEVTLAQSQVTGLTSDLAAKLPLAGGTMTGQLNFSGTTHAGIKLLSLTTTQRNALTPANGMLIYNTTTATVQKYEAGAWAAVGSGSGGYSLTATTTDATQTELLTAEAARLTLPDNTAWGFTALFTGRYNGGGYGVNWTARESNRAWTGIASSSDGTKLAACDSSPGYIYVSGDSGVTWTARASSQDWYGIASSSDGTKLAATVNSGQIWTSGDSGVTWTEQSSGIQNWGGIASSSNGTKLAAITNGYIYVSGDSGVTWTARASSQSWYGIASSSDGTKLAATVSSGQIWTSGDSGVTWVARESSRLWIGITSSDNGTKLAAVVSSGQIWTSGDSGVTWTEQSSGSREWWAIACSSDGTKLVATVASISPSGQVWTSSDSGVTWTQRSFGSDNSSYAIASSSDGTKLAATVNGGQIYTSTESGSPAASETCEFKGHAVRDSGAASMSISALQENPIGDNTAGRFVCQADLTNGALQFLATGAASETWKWGVSVQTVEVTP